MGDEPEIAAPKATFVVPVSVQMAEDAGRFAQLLGDAITKSLFGPPPPPPPDPGPHPKHVELLEAAKGQAVLVEILELHQPKPFTVHQDGSVPWWQCRGDEFSGYDGEPPDWPCETVGIIARHLGVDLATSEDGGE